MDETVDFAGEDGTRLVGTLTFPDAARPAPGTLLLSGSGPLDRDSNMPGQRLEVAAALAGALATHGVASLRYDKRGVGTSDGDYLTTGFERETSDASAVLAALRRNPAIDRCRVTICGHSAGATIAIRLAAADDALAGAALLCGAASAGAEVMAWQTARIAATLTGPARPLAPLFVRYQARTRRRLQDSSRDVIRVGWSRSPARWTREYMAYAPAADLAVIRCPVLAITGRKDVQVDAADVARMAELVPGPFTGETPDDLTHLLRTTQRPPGLSGYRAQIGEPPEADLLARLATWIAARVPPR